jgi:hypothetical protein
LIAAQNDPTGAIDETTSQATEGAQRERWSAHQPEDQFHGVF